MTIQSESELLNALLKVNCYAEAVDVLRDTTVPLDAIFCEKFLHTVEQWENRREPDATQIRRAFNFLHEFLYRVTIIVTVAPKDAREFVQSLAAQPSQDAIDKFQMDNRQRFDANIVAALRSYGYYTDRPNQQAWQWMVQFANILTESLQLRLPHNPPKLYQNFVSQLYQAYKANQMLDQLKVNVHLIDLPLVYTVAGLFDNMQADGDFTADHLHFIESLAKRLSDWQDEDTKVDFQDVLDYLYKYLLSLIDKNFYPEGYAFTLANLGWVHVYKSVDVARRYLEEGLGLPVASPDIRSRLLFLAGLSSEEIGKTTGGTDDYRRAQDYYREWQALWPHDHPQWFEATFHLAQSMLQDRNHTLEELEEARQLLLKCKEHYEGANDIAHAFILDLLGEIMLQSSGDRAANLEEAIGYLEGAESLFEANQEIVVPTDLGINQNRLGQAYKDRIAGLRDQNLKVAARCFRKAAEICPPEVNLNEYVSAIYNLASVLREASESLEDVQEGIGLIEKALEHDDLEKRPLYYAADMLEKSNLHLEAYRHGADGQLDAGVQSIQMALGVPEVEKDRVLLVGLLVTYGKMVLQMPNIPDEAEGLLRRAVEVAKSVSDRQGTTAFASFNLGQLLARHSHTEEALDLYRAAIEMFEEDITAESSADFSTYIERHTGAMYEATVELLIKFGRYEEALDYLERNKARTLGWMIAAREALPSADVPSELLEEYLALRERKRYLRTRSRLMRFGREPSSHALTRLRQSGLGFALYIRVADFEVAANERMLEELQPRLAEVVRKIRELEPEFEPTPRWTALSLKEIGDLLAPERAIIEFATTDNGTYLFLMTMDDTGAVAIRVLEAPQASRASLRRLVEQEWLEPYHLYRKATLSGGSEARKLRNAWRSAIEDIGPRIASLSDFPTALQVLTNAGVKELVLVPYQIFHILPLHLMSGINGGYICDEYKISYAPSLQILAACQRRTDRGRSKAFIVQNPDGSLVFSDLEVRLIKEFFSDPNALVGDECCWRPVQCGMTGAEVFHYSGHAFFEPRSPLASSLVLSDRMLTLGEIMASSDLSACSMVVLSACETNRVSFSLPADEYTGLSGGLLYAGAPTVLGTLWVVEDNAAPLVMQEFYRNFVGRGVEQGEAFEAAIDRIRTVTAADILKELDKPGADSDPALNRLLVFCRLKRDKTVPLFDHPEYWAAFTLVGRS